MLGGLLGISTENSCRESTSMKSKTQVAYLFFVELGFPYTNQFRGKSVDCDLSGYDSGGRVPQTLLLCHGALIPEHSNITQMKILVLLNNIYLKFRTYTHLVVTRRYALHLASLSPNLQRGFTKQATSREVPTPPKQTS